jgi:hypothetical protein
MTTNIEQLDDAIEKADHLLSTLQAISAVLGDVKKRFDELPTEDELRDLSNAIPSAIALKDFAEAWNSDKLPSIDDLDEYADAASKIGQALSAA